MIFDCLDRFNVGTALRSFSPTFTTMESRIITLKLSPSVLSKFPAGELPAGVSTPSNKKSKKAKGAKPGNAPSSPTGPEDGSATPSRGQHAKPGPKPGGFVVNAAIKALDRSGAPTRRWTKKPLELKSFTGFQFNVIAWEGEEEEGEGGEPTVNGNSNGTEDANGVENSVKQESEDKMDEEEIKAE